MAFIRTILALALLLAAGPLRAQTADSFSMSLDSQSGAVCIKDAAATETCSVFDSTNGLYNLNFSPTSELTSMQYSFAGGTFGQLKVTRKDGTTLFPILDYDSGKNAYYFKMPGDSKIYAQFFYDVNRPHFTGQS